MHKQYIVQKALSTPWTKKVATRTRYSDRLATVHELSSQQRIRGRRLLLVFTFFNSFSFLLVTGNIISLYMLRLGATATQIGIVAALPFFSYFFMLPGRVIVRLTGVVRLFGLAWLLRYLAVSPILFAPLAFARGGPYAAFLVVGLATLGFNAARGLGIVANAPLFGGYATERDRGTLISASQVISGTLSIFTGIAAAILLGAAAPVERYTLFLAVGITSGFVATVLAFFLPDLPASNEQARSPFVPNLRRALKRRDLRRFVLVFALVAVCSGIGRSYFVLFAKLVYEQSDRAALLFTTIGSVGNIIAALIGGLLLDRLGAKPQIQIALVIHMFAAGIAVWSPVGSTVVVVASLSFLFFLGMIAVMGGEIASQAYFYGITPESDRLDLGILYFVVLGVGGATGAFAGGFLVDALAGAGYSSAAQFRGLFGVSLVVAALGFLVASRLPRLGARSVSSTLGVMFSLRDLRAAGMLNRLSRAQSAVQERDTLREIAGSGSRLPVSDVLDRLQSPSYIVRTEALDALTHLPYSQEIEAVLITHLKKYEFTTAASAARYLGLRGSKQAVPQLRVALESEDYWLRAKSLVALARVRDEESYSQIAYTMQHDDNPTVLIHAGAAIRIAGITDAVPAVLKRIAQADLPSFVLDELIAALANQIELGAWFYPAYSEFVREGSDAERILEREIAGMEASPDLRAAASNIESAPHLSYQQLQSIATGTVVDKFPFEGAAPIPRVAFFLVAAAASSSLGS